MKHEKSYEEVRKMISIRDFSKKYDIPFVTLYSQLKKREDLQKIIYMVHGVMKVDEEEFKRVYCTVQTLYEIKKAEKS